MHQLKLNIFLAVQFKGSEDNKNLALVRNKGHLVPFPIMITNESRDAAIQVVSNLRAARDYSLIGVQVKSQERT